MPWLNKSFPDWRWWTGAFIVAAIAGHTLWEFIVLWRAPANALISPIIMDFVWRHPFAALATGVLIGHWMWTIKYYRPASAMTVRYWALGIVAVASLGLDIMGVLPMIVPLVYVAIGVAMGRLLCPARVRL